MQSPTWPGRGQGRWVNRCEWLADVCLWILLALAVSVASVAVSIT